MFLILGYDETETAELLQRCVSFYFTVALVSPSHHDDAIHCHGLPFLSRTNIFFRPFFLNSCSPVAAVSIVLQIMLKVALI